jgi:hypothetical protein
MSGIVPISGTSFGSANGTTDGINETSMSAADNVGWFNTAHRGRVRRKHLLCDPQRLDALDLRRW